MYDFVFDGGAAKLILKSTGETVVLQPFKPVNAGSEPWADADEARAWMEANYPQFFEDFPEPVAEENPGTPAAEESAGQGE